MNSNTILHSDVLDILFENRNKAYGAYVLRRYYPDRIKTALLLMLGIAAAFSAFSLLPGRNTGKSGLPVIDSIVVKQYQNVEEPDKPKEQPKTEPQASQRKFISAIQVVPETEVTDTLADITDMHIGSTTIISDVPDAPVEPVVVEPAPVALTPVPAENTNEPVANPDILPTYPGGTSELIKFLERHLQNPSELNEGESVQVQIKFVVDYDGNLQSFDVIKDGGTAFNNEVVRVLKAMPRWNPGKKGGRNVPVYFTLPVKFTAAE